MKNFIYIVFFVLLPFVGKTQTNHETPPNLEKQKTIIIYGSPDCHFCVATKKLFLEHNIPFVFYDIDTNKEALNEMLDKLKKNKISLNNLGIPVVDKYGEIFTNNEADFEAFLKKLIP
jgi:glutaredoxin